VISELSSASTPRPAKTVRAPKASGIAAAMSERKTSSRTRISSGAASSSARSVVRSDSCCRARETSAKPDWVARKGGWTCRASVRSSAGAVSRIAMSSAT